MKKLILIGLLIGQMFIVSFSWATDYFGCATASVNSDNTFCTTPTGSCTGSSAVSAATALQAGNNLYANGCTLSISDTFTATGIFTTDGDAGGSAVAGGTFTIDLSSVKGKTITANITAGAEHCLQVSGAADAGTQLTLSGNINGSSTTNTKYGVGDTHTVGNIVVSGNITGGGNSGATGYVFSGATGSISVTGNASASATGSGLGSGVALSAAGTGTITGNCFGEGLSGTTVGCAATSTGGLTINGSIINGSRSVAISGKIIWNPTAPEIGIGSYFKSDGGGSAVYTGTMATATDVITGKYFINKADGVVTQGSASSSGGGAWAF